MSDKTIDIFRLRIHTEDMFSTEAALIEAMRDSERPFCMSGKNKWIVGRVPKSEERKLYFEFGRITTKPTGRYDLTDNKFIQTEGSDAFHTMMYIDFEDQTVGIIRNSRLAQRTDTIAKNYVNAIRGKNIEISLGIILDPTDFIKQLLDAYCVTSFSVTYNLPNNGLSPGKIYDLLTSNTKEFGAEETTLTTRKSSGIERVDKLADLAKEANEMGYPSKARIKDTEKSTARPINMAGQKNASFSVSDDNLENHSGIFAEIKKLFRKFKGPSK